MVKAYIPDCGDVVWLNCDPQAGHEQAGHRPALPAACRTTGVVLCDQIRNLDWQARMATLKEQVGHDFARQVLARLMPLLEW